MVCRTALIGLLAAMLPAGCSRTDVPTSAKEVVAAETVAQQAAAPQGNRLASPVRIEVDGKPLVRGVRTLFPFVGDLDGDGRQDLLVGTDVYYEPGRLMVYRNVGTNARPRLSGPQWFDDTVPTGRIPMG